MHFSKLHKPILKFSPVKWFSTVLAIGVLVSACMSWSTYDSNQASVSSAVNRQAIQLSKQLKQQFELYEYGLRGIRGYVLTSGVENLSYQTFAQFMSSQNIAKEFPGALGLGFIRKVPISQQHAFVEQNKRLIDPNFSIRTLSEHSQTRFIIELIEPLAQNDKARGLDIGSEAFRRQAAELAALSGSTHLTAPITLVQAEGNPQQSFLMLLPVYNSWTTPTTLEEREKNTVGWAYAPLIIEDVVNTVSLNKRHFHVHLSDVTNDKALPFFDSDEHTINDATQHVTLSLFGRTWNIDVSATGFYIDNSNQWTPLTVFALCILVSFLFAVSAYLYRTNQFAQLKKVESQRRLASIIENSVDAILTVSIKGKILDLNKSAERLFESKSQVLVGQPLDSLNFIELPAHAPLSFMETALKGTVIKHKELTLRLKNGDKAYLIMSAVPITNQRKKVVSLSLALRDVSDLIRTNQRLVESKEQADKANAAKSQFLANMSHELRTPMNASLGMLQLLNSTELTAQQKDYTIKAESSAKSLLAVLNDILDFSKIEAGKLEINEDDFALDELVSHIANLLTGDYANHGIEIVFNIEPQIPQTLHGDLLRITQIMSNLVINALKFTHNGYVDVAVNELQRDEDQIILHFAVRDSGIGISLDQQQIIFQSFQQAQGTSSRQYAGTGLGLTITKRLLELLGGQLTVESELEKGSCFSFALPLKYHEPQRYLELSLIKPYLKSVLLVGNNALEMEMISELLSAAKVDVSMAYSATQLRTLLGQDIAQKPVYDLIIIDWRLKDADSVSLCHEIKQAFGAKVSPKFLLTAAYSEKLVDLYASQKNNFDALLTKPVTPRNLVNKIVEMFQPSHAAEVPSEISCIQTLPLQDLHIMVVEDNELNRQVTDELLTLMGASISLCHGGLQAVQTFQDLTNRPDVILMDIQMPDIDGYEATKRIRRLPRGDDVLIVALTANVSDQDKQLSLQAGMDAHVGKPVDISELVRVIDGLLGKHNANPKPVIETVEKDIEKTLNLRSDPKNDEHILEPRSGILNRFADNEALVVKMVANFFTESHKLITSLRHAVQNNHGDKMLKDLHAFKGIAATVGATYLAKKLADYELKVKDSDSFAAIDEQVFEDICEISGASEKALLSMFPPSTNTTTENKFDQRPPDITDSELDSLLTLLQSNNLEAIQFSASLLARNSHNLQINVIHDLVEILDFTSASALVCQLMKQMQEASSIS